MGTRIGCRMCEWGLWTPLEPGATQEAALQYEQWCLEARALRDQHEHSVHHQGAYDVGPWCNLCGRAEETEAHVIAHQAEEHRDLNLPYSCDFCGRLYQTKGELDHHVETRHDDN